MTRLIDALMQAPNDAILFIAEDGAPIAAGAVHAQAAMLAPRVASRPGPLFIHTKSAAMFCAGYIAAAAAGRALALLPQGGADYRAEIGVADKDFLTDSDPGGVRIDDSDEAADLPDRLNDPDLIFFTSGSSGASKLVARPAGAVAAEARMWADWMDGGVRHVAATVSHQHIYGLIFRVFVPVLGGLSSSDKAALSWEALSAQLAPDTLVVSSPAHLTRLPERDVAPALAPKMVISSGGPLPWKAAREATTLFGFAPMEILGSTETSGVARRFRNAENEPWTPLDGVDLSLDEDGVLQAASAFTGEAEAVKMGDRAIFFDDGRFELGGRVDRILKVEGKRVSLARVEAVFRELDAVEEIVLLPTQQGGRERLSAIVVLGDAAKLELGEAGAFAFSRGLITATGDALAPAERPKRWRFVSDIPVNSQAKRVQRDLAALFEAPRMLDLLKPDLVEVEAEKARLMFTVAPDLPWFEGHFKDAPVVPGVAQVHIAVRLAEEIWSAAPANASVSRMKFVQIIRPGDRVEVRLTFDFTSRRLTVEMSDGETRYSSAVIG